MSSFAAYRGVSLLSGEGFPVYFNWLNALRSMQDE